MSACFLPRHSQNSVENALANNNAKALLASVGNLLFYTPRKRGHATPLHTIAGGDCVHSCKRAP